MTEVLKQTLCVKKNWLEALNKMFNLVTAFLCIVMICSTAFAGGAVPSGQNVTLPADVYKAILERLDHLQNRVDELEGTKSSVDKITTDIDDIYDTLDRVETKTLQDRVNLGVELRTRLDNFRSSDYLFNYVTGETKDNSKDNAWSNRFRLNISADIMQGLSFHGRLTVYKNWASSNAPVMFYDANSAHVPSDSSVKLDRAYVDWIVPNMPLPIAITFGRQPSYEGPPFELRENRLRQSTYPALLFDGESDGIIATFGLSKFTKIDNNGLRMAYFKGFQNNDSITTYRRPRNFLDDLNVFAAFFEGEIPSVPNSLFVLGYTRGNGYVDNPNNPTASLGDMDNYIVHTQADNIMKSGFDFFFSWGVNKSHPNGNVGTGDTVDPAGNIFSFSMSSDPSNGVYPGIPMGLLSDDGEQSHTGWAIYTGVRYTLPVSLLNLPKLGFEFNHGSKFWFSYTQGSDDIYNRLATRGNAYDIYYIQPFNRYLFMRAGYTWVDYEYSGSGIHFGEPQESDESLSDFYILLDCRF